MKVQIIEKNGKPEWAVLPYKEYENLMEAAEMAEDIRDLKKFRQEDDGERIPADVVNRILDGENPIRVWRGHLNMTQEQLAQKAGISKPYLSQIEKGKRTGKPEVLKSIATALDLTIDDLIQ
ncbi:MAG: helix-turn-helix transcriptional regulator [Nitrospinae bacterium]|nr:helix-turn-helix transcriptional regulator [Nitrospinota bacterium]